MELNTTYFKQGYLDYVDKKHQQLPEFPGEAKDQNPFGSNLFAPTALFFGTRTFFGVNKGQIYKVNLENLIKVLGHKRWIKVFKRPGESIQARETLDGKLKIKYKPINRSMVKATFSPQEYAIIKHEMVLYLKSAS